nr:calcium uptake protein 3, mitochondrial-like isoform X2 [Oncorhynchus nerka]
MAAFRRLASIVNRLNVWSAPRNELLGAQTTTGGRTQRCLAVGMCLATGGVVAFYFYNDMYSQRCRKRMGYRFSGRDLLPVLSAVEAQQKTRPFDFEEGDVYMSSHEQRFRLFSSVEYEGQLYMTPQNFIESVTMSEPRNKKPWMSLTKQV